MTLMTWSDHSLTSRKSPGWICFICCLKTFSLCIEAHRPYNSSQRECECCLPKWLWSQKKKKKENWSGHHPKCRKRRPKYKRGLRSQHNIKLARLFFLFSWSFGADYFWVASNHSKVWFHGILDTGRSKDLSRYEVWWTAHLPNRTSHEWSWHSALWTNMSVQSIASFLLQRDLLFTSMGQW